MENFISKYEEPYVESTTFVFEDSFGDVAWISGVDSSSKTGTIAALDVDGYYSNVAFLLQSSSGDFKDRKGNSVVVHGNPYYDPNEGKFSTGSFYFDGVDDFISSILSQPALGSQGFTVEFWFKRTSSDVDWLFNCRTGVNGDGIDIREDGYVTTANNILSNPLTISTNVWHHFLIARFEGAGQAAVDCWIDGSWKGRGTSTNNFTGTTLQIGGSSTGNIGYFQGYIDQLRITKGIQRYKYATNQVTTYPLGNATVNPFPTTVESSVGILPSIQSYSGAGILSTQIGNYSIHEVLGVSGQGFLGSPHVSATVVLYLAGLGSKSYLSISVDPFQGKSGNSVDLYFGQGWPSQTALDLKLHFYQYQVSLASSLENTLLESFGTVPKVEGFLQFDFKIPYSGVDSELIVYNFTSITDYLDAILGRLVPQIYGDSSNTAVWNNILEEAYVQLLGLHTAGSLSSELSSVSSTFIGRFASGTLSGVLSNVTSAFVGKVPIPITATLSGTLSNFTTTISGRYSSGQLQRLLDNCTVSMDGTTIYRGYFSGTLEGVNRNITGEFHSPRQGTLSSALERPTTQIFAFYIFPVEGNLIALLENAYVDADASLAIAGTIEIRIEDYYEIIDDFYFDDKIYLPNSERASLHFRQPRYSLSSSMYAVHANGTLSAVTGASTFIAYAGVSVFGTIQHGWAGYSRSTDFNLEDSPRYENFNFRFQNPNSFSVEFIGVHPATVMNMNLLSLTGSFSGWTEIEGIVEGLPIYVPNKPLDFQFSKNRIQEHTNNLYFKSPNMEDLKSNIIALTIYGPYGRFEVNLAPLTPILLGFGHIIAELVTYYNNIKYSPKVVLDLKDNYQTTKEFAWWNDSLTLSTWIEGTTTGEVPEFHVTLEDITPQVQGHIYSYYGRTAGYFKNHAEYVAGNADFYLEEDTLGLFKQYPGFLEFDRSVLDLSADLSIKVIPHYTGEFSASLSPVASSTHGKGHILGYWGGEYEAPKELAFEFDDSGKHVVSWRDFSWNYSDRLQDVIGNIRGGELSGYIASTLSNLLPYFRLSHPIPVTGTMQGSMPALIPQFRLNNPKPMWIEGYLASISTDIRLTTWLRALGTIQANTGNSLKMYTQGRVPYGAFISNAASPFSVSGIFQARTIIHVQATLDTTTRPLTWNSTDSSRRGTIEILTESVGKVEVKATLSITGNFHKPLDKFSLILGGWSEISGTLSSNLYVFPDIEGNTSLPVTAHFNKDLDPATFESYGAGSIYGSLTRFSSDGEIAPSDLIIKRVQWQFVGYTTIFASLSLKMDRTERESTYLEFKGLIPGQYYGGMIGRNLITSVNIQLATTLEGVIESQLGKIDPYIRGSSVGLYFRPVMQDVKSNIRLRASIFVDLSPTLSDVEMLAQGITPKIIQGLFESRVEPPITYIELFIRSEGTIELVTEKLTSQIYSGHVTGRLDNPKLNNFTVTINAARQGPLFSTLASVLEDATAEIKILTTAVLVLDAALQRVGAEFVGTFPTETFGGIRIETKDSLRAKFEGRSYRYVHVDFSAKLADISPMLKIFFPTMGTVEIVTPELERRFVGITPLRISTIVDIHPYGVYGEIKLHIPTKGYIDTEIGRLRPLIFGWFIVGKLEGELSGPSPKITGRVRSNTKVSLVAKTDTFVLDVLGVINTEGVIDAKDVGSDLKFSADARIPPKLIRIKGSLSSTTESFHTDIFLKEVFFRVNLDLNPVGVQSDIKLLIPFQVSLEKILWDLQPDFVLNHKGAGIDLSLQMGAVIPKIKAAFLVFGYFVPKLDEINLQVEEYVPSIRIGRLSSLLDRTYSSSEIKTNQLLSNIFGYHEKVTYGRLSSELDSFSRIIIKGITPFDIFGVGEIFTNTAGMFIEGYCPPCGILATETSTLNSTFVAIQNSFVLDIVMDRYEPSLKGGFELFTPGKFPMRMFLKMESFKLNFETVAEIHVRFDIHTAPFRLTRIVGDLGITGRIIGGDIPYELWYYAYVKEDERPPEYRGPHPGDGLRRIYQDVVVDAGYNPGSPMEPKNKKFWTLGYVKGEFYLHIPIEIRGKFQNVWERTEDYNDPWWIKEDQGVNAPTHITTKLIVSKVEIKGNIPIYGTMHINALNGTPDGSAGYELDNRVVWPQDPGFVGYLDEYHYKGSFHRKLRDLKPKITMDVRNYEGLFDNFLDPLDFAAYSTATVFGKIDSVVSVDFAFIEATAAHKNEMTMDFHSGNLVSRIKGQVREYIYGVFFQSLFILNEDVAEVDAEYAPSRLQFKGTVLNFGKIFLDLEMSTDNTLAGDFRLFAGGSFAVISARLSPLRARIPAKHIGFSEVLMSMVLRLEGVTPTVTGGMDNAGWLVGTTPKVLASIVAHTAFKVIALLGENFLEDTVFESTGIVEIWGEASGTLDDAACDFEAFMTPPIEGSFEKLLESLQSGLVLCIPTEGTIDEYLQDLNYEGDVTFGPKGDAELRFSDLISQIFVNRYYDSDLIPPEFGKEIAGDVVYGYQRGLGSAIRIYDDSNEELLFVDHLGPEEKDYSFANVMEGEYYVVGVPSNQNSRSEVLDELSVELEN